MKSFKLSIGAKRHCSERTLKTKLLCKVTSTANSRTAMLSYKQTNKQANKHKIKKSTRVFKELQGL